MNVKKDYKVGEEVIHAVDGVSLDFRRSEFVAILGPSGCGKTTMMNIIGGLDRYTSGDMTVNGQTTKVYKDKDWDNYRNKQIGFVFQSYNLISHLSVLGNVEIALTISGIPPAERTKRAKDALTEVGLGEQLYKRPNQLSGGQMQRVAIARALVNRPEILLADEPTGALDTKTSEQIMDLIKKISANRLVVMVTHNPEIAEQYANRIIKMKDGKILDDTNPYRSEDDAEFQEEVKALKSSEAAAVASPKKQEKKSAMSFLTAISLSARNLKSKLRRSVLTSIASAIGILGIGLIMAISNGMNVYMDGMIAGSMESTPVTVGSSGLDISALMNERMGNNNTLDKFPNIDKIYAQIAETAAKTVITDDYVQYLKNNIKAEWVNDIVYDTGMKVDFYGIRAGTTDYSLLTASSGNALSSLMGGGSFSQMQNSDFVSRLYDPLTGKVPTEKDEVALVVDEYNRISATTLEAIGIKVIGDSSKTEFTFEELVGAQIAYKVLTNDQRYVFDGVNNKFVENTAVDFEDASVLTLHVAGILRLKESSETGLLSQGVVYTKALTEWLLEQNSVSEIVKYMEADATQLLNPLTGTNYMPSFGLTGTTSAAEVRETAFRTYGGIFAGAKYKGISIYSTDLNGRNGVKDVLNAYNKDNPDAVVEFSDIVETMGSVMNSILGVITAVLIGFTAISLVVSAVMISIITSISVLERTKEIGVLRSIGARKKDITRVFNAETMILGLLSGIIGVAVTLLLSIPINLIMKSSLEVDKIAQLSFVNGLLLVVVSVAVTLLSGLIPAKGASKKDPVVALRTE
jgi:putative ABC transport system permease protein